MEYIQKVFLGVRDYMQAHPGQEEMIAFLDAEPPVYRSVAYESAAMEVALHDLSQGSRLQRWHALYQSSGETHAFHLEIGLGWALAMAEIAPAAVLDQPVSWMVYDGIGYYHALFKARRTIRYREVPAGVENHNHPGFDQGLGRRLWYHCKGSVGEVALLVQTFAPERQPALWRGVGIACGYVGGSRPSDLEILSALSDKFKSSLCTGTALAVISRYASGSITPDIEVCCRVLCGMTLEDVLNLSVSKIDAPGKPDQQWIAQMEMQFF